MDWNDSYIASVFLPIAIRLSSRAHSYCNSGPRRRIVQPEISICSGEEYPISATGRSSPRCAHKRWKTTASCFFQTRFVWKESVMMKPTKAFGCGWEHDWMMCAFLYRLTSDSETQLFRHRRNWNIPRSSNFLHLNCMP